MKWLMVAAVIALAGCAAPDAGAPPTDGQSTAQVLAWQFMHAGGLLCSDTAPDCGPHFEGNCQLDAKIWLSHHDHPGVLHDVRGTIYVVVQAGDWWVDANGTTQGFSSHTLDVDMEPIPEWRKDEAQHPQVLFNAPCDANSVALHMNMEARDGFSAQRADLKLRTPSAA